CSVPYEPCCSLLRQPELQKERTVPGSQHPRPFIPLFPLLNGRPARGTPHTQTHTHTLAHTNIHTCTPIHTHTQIHPHHTHTHTHTSTHKFIKETHTNTHTHIQIPTHRQKYTYTHCVYLSKIGRASCRE